MTLKTHKMIPVRIKQSVFPIMNQITTILLESYRCAKKIVQLKNLMHLNFHRIRLLNSIVLADKDIMEMSKERSQVFFRLSLGLNIKLGKNLKVSQKNLLELNL